MRIFSIFLAFFILISTLVIASGQSEYSVTYSSDVLNLKLEEDVVYYINVEITNNSPYDVIPLLDSEAEDMVIKSLGVTVLSAHSVSDYTIPIEFKESGEYETYIDLTLERVDNRGIRRIPSFSIPIKATVTESDDIPWIVWLILLILGFLFGGVLVVKWLMK